MPKRRKDRESKSGPKRAVIYCRVSSDKQEREGFSIPAQQDLLRNYAQEAGIEIAQEFVDVETAKQAGRTNFSAMISFLEDSSDCKTILVEKTDRLYRNLKDWVLIDELGLEVHLVKENEVLSKSSSSHQMFVHGIKVLVAKNHIDNLKEETRKGMLKKARSGYFPSNSPFGYRNVVGADGKKTIAPDEQIAPFIIKIFEWYATGDYSLSEVAKKAKENGLRYRSGRKVAKGYIHKALRNRVYMGEFEWDGEIYSGNYQPLVSQELWQRVQNVLDGRFSKRSRKRKHGFAYSGLIRCGHCGCSLVGQIQKKRYVYYHCSGAKGKCPEPYTREEVFEDLFTDILGQLEFDEEVLEWIREALKASHADERVMHQEAVEALQEQHRRLQNRLEIAYEDRVDGRITAEEYDSRSAAWRGEQEELERAMARHRSANRNYLDEGIQLLELAKSAQALFVRQNAHEKRKLLNFLLSNCSWKGGVLTAEFKQPFDMLAKTNLACQEKTASERESEGRFDFWLRIPPPSPTRSPESKLLRNRSPEITKEL